MDDTTRRLLVAVRDGAGAPTDLAANWQALLARDPEAGVAAAFDLLAGEPRLKPSRYLVLDPSGSVRQRWQLRVAAAAALLDAPVAAQVFDEVRDELATEPDLAADVLGTDALGADVLDGREPGRALSEDQRRALRALVRPG